MTLVEMISVAVVQFLVALLLFSLTALVGFGCLALDSKRRLWDAQRRDIVRFWPSPLRDDLHAHQSRKS